MTEIIEKPASLKTPPSFFLQSLDFEFLCHGLFIYLLTGSLYHVVYLQTFFQNPKVEETSYEGEPEARDLGNEFHWIAFNAI